MIRIKLDVDAIFESEHFYTTENAEMITEALKKCKGKWLSLQRAKEVVLQVNAIIKDNCKGEKSAINYFFKYYAYFNDTNF